MSGLVVYDIEKTSRILNLIKSKSPFHATPSFSVLDRELNPTYAMSLPDD